MNARLTVAASLLTTALAAGAGLAGAAAPASALMDGTARFSTFSACQDFRQDIIASGGTASGCTTVWIGNPPTMWYQTTYTL